MSAEDTERSTQLRRLRLAGPLGRHAARERTSATSVLPQSGSQQQLASHCRALRLQMHEHSNLVHGLRGKGRGGGCTSGGLGVSANGRTRRGGTARVALPARRPPRRPVDDSPARRGAA